MGFAYLKKSFALNTNDLVAIQMNYVCIQKYFALNSKALAFHANGCTFVHLPYSSHQFAIEQTTVLAPIEQQNAPMHTPCIVSKKTKKNQNVSE